MTKLYKIILKQKSSTLNPLTIILQNKQEISNKTDRIIYLLEETQSKRDQSTHLDTTPAGKIKKMVEMQFLYMIILALAQSL